MYKKLNSVYAFLGNPDDAIFSPSGGPKVNALDGFNEDLYNYYINTNKYSEAVRYARMYPFLDIRQRHANEMDLLKLEEEGRKHEALLGKFTKTEQDRIKFSNSVFNRAAFEELGSNEFTDKFNNIKELLATNGLGKDKDQVINQLEVTFAPNKRKFLLWEIENDNSYENFLRKSGFTEQYLRDNDVDVVNNGDGGFTMKFNYNADVSNLLLYNLATHSNSSDFVPIYGDQSLKIMAYDTDGNPINSKIGQFVANDLPFETMPGTYLDIYKRYIDKQQSKVNELTSEYAQTSPGRSYGPVSDRIYSLQQLYNKTPSSDTNRRSKIEKMINFEEENVISKLRQFPFITSRILANIGTQDKSGYLNEVSQDDAANIQRWVSDYLSTATNDKILEAISLGEVGGEFGVYISLPSNIEKKLMNDVRNHDYINIFVPNLFADEAKEKAYRDTGYRATRKLDDLEAYNYDYYLKDGRKVTTERNYINNSGDYRTNFYIENKDGIKVPVSKSDVEPLIEKEYMVDNLYDEFFWKYHNKDGKIINKEALKEELEIYSIICANSLIKKDEDITYSEVFGPTPAKPDTLRNDVYNKWRAALEIYAGVIKRLNSEQ